MVIKPRKAGNGLISLISIVILGFETFYILQTILQEMLLFSSIRRPKLYSKSWAFTVGTILTK
jgi:hypothetical protein